ncbi:hypothetical protein DFJ73DRAFT_929736 [Zopfochytrium polystomum]|nr:hypothetical protein DFJ73DRAFT_929736 [Zopfochytrium polystomum]
MSPQRVLARKRLPRARRARHQGCSCRARFRGGASPGRGQNATPQSSHRNPRSRAGLCVSRCALRLKSRVKERVQRRWLGWRRRVEPALEDVGEEDVEEEVEDVLLWRAGFTAAGAATAAWRRAAALAVVAVHLVVVVEVLVVVIVAVFLVVVLGVAFFREGTLDACSGGQPREAGGGSARVAALWELLERKRVELDGGGLGVVSFVVWVVVRIGQGEGGSDDDRLATPDVATGSPSAFKLLSRWWWLWRCGEQIEEEGEKSASTGGRGGGRRKAQAKGRKGSRRPGGADRCSTGPPREWRLASPLQPQRGWWRRPLPLCGGSPREDCIRVSGAIRDGGGEALVNVGGVVAVLAVAQVVVVGLVAVKRLPSKVTLTRRQRVQEKRGSTMRMPIVTIRRGGRWEGKERRVEGRLEAGGSEMGAKMLVKCTV